MDVILQKFMEPARWVKAIHKGVDKDIPKNVLYQLTKEETRLRLYQAINLGKYEIAPPHTAQIPKEEKGEFRTVYVNEPADRIFLSIANDLLFELMPEMIHKNCKSYLSGTGCGDVVIGISSAIMKAEEKSRDLLREALDSVGGKYEWQDGYEPCVSATIGGILQYVNVKKIWVNDENIVMLNVLPSDDCMYYDIAVSKLEFGQIIEIADDMVHYAMED